MLALSLWLGLGCTSMVNHLAVKRIVPVGLAEPDLGKACGLGESLNHPLKAIGSDTPNKAMIVAEVTAALCEEFPAWNAEINAARALKTATPETKIALVKDARIQAERAHTRAALRYHRSFQYLEKAYGELGGEQCPQIPEDEEALLIVGAIGGTLAVLHSKYGAGEAGVPEGLLPKIARSMKCLDNEKWWHVPDAIKAAVWAALPGAAPEGVDPWVLFEDASRKGESSGVRIGWGMYSLIAANAGASDKLKMGIKAHGKTRNEHKTHTGYGLLDEYAYWVSRHQSDLIWVEATGYRTPVFGDLPENNEAEIESEEEDAFEEDFED